MSAALPPAAAVPPAVTAAGAQPIVAAESDAGEHDGAVKWFDVKKGFGFIVGPNGQDVFVHFSAIQGPGFRTLRDGERVHYELNQGDKGYHAANVRRAERPRGEVGEAEQAEAGGREAFAGQSVG